MLLCSGLQDSDMIRVEKVPVEEHSLWHDRCAGRWTRSSRKCFSLCFIKWQSWAQTSIQTRNISLIFLLTEFCSNINDEPELFTGQLFSDVAVVTVYLGNLGHLNNYFMFLNFRRSFRRIRVKLPLNFQKIMYSFPLLLLQVVCCLSRKWPVALLHPSSPPAVRAVTCTVFFKRPLSTSGIVSATFCSAESSRSTLWSRQTQNQRECQQQSHRGAGKSGRVGGFNRIYTIHPC